MLLQRLPDRTRCHQVLDARGDSWALAIVDAIERLGYRTDRQRPSMPTRVKLLVAARAIRQSLQEHGDARKLGTA